MVENENETPIPTSEPITPNDPTSEVPSDTTAELLYNDLAGVSETMPMLAPNEYAFKVASCTLEKGTKGQLIKITLKTRDATRSITGELLPAGYPVYDIISLTPTEAYTKDAIQRRLKVFRKAVTGEDGGAFGIPSQYQNQTVRATTKIMPAKDVYTEKVVVARYTI